MKEVNFEITQWPAGQSLDVVFENGGSMVIAGVHGGGVGHTVKRFKAHPVYLKRAITKICEDWEEYKSAEPLIKDEKIRKAVRAWAEANSYTKLWVYHDHTAISFYNEDDGDNEITFNTMEKFGLEHLKCYTVIELCGEEEKPRPVIANGIKYDSFADYLKSREEKNESI